MQFEAREAVDGKSRWQVGNSRLNQATRSRMSLFDAPDDFQSTFLLPLCRPPPRLQPL